MRRPQLHTNLLTLNERVDLAAEHLAWVSRRQPPGKFVIRAFAPRIGPQPLRLVSTEYFDNRDPQFRHKLKHHLRYCFKKPWHTFYGVNAFEIADAKARNVSSSRLAQVDADSVKLPVSGPKPTRIVNTSAGNYQFLYELDSALSREEIEAVSAYLTNLVGGDQGGHSSAKLLRVPGSFNVKPAYNPAPLVSVIDSSGPVHSAVEMLERARAAGPSANRPPSVKRRGSRGPVPSPAAIRKKYLPQLSQDVRLRLRQSRPYESFTLQMGSREYVVPRDDRSVIIFQIGCAFRDAGATPEETLSVIRASAFWRDREADGKRENPNRLIEKIFAETTAAEHGDDNRLVAIDPADWAGKPVPVRDWLAEPFVPMRKVTGLYGDGGTGKTTIALQLALAVALGRGFLGVRTKKGRVFALLAEDEEEDTHITIAGLCRHYDIELTTLRDQMLIAPRASADNILVTFRDDRPITTPLFDRVLKKVKAFRPVLIILDTAADTFGGNEILRAQVRAFVGNCCGRLAQETGAAVLLLAHPSQAGLTSKRGDGGSTAWSNSMRSRLFLSYSEDEDPNGRVLELKKANLAEIGTTLHLRRLQNGAYEKVDATTKKNTITADEARVIEEVSRAFEERRPWSAHPQAGHRWLGTRIMELLHKNKSQSRAIILRLLNRRKLVIVEYDKHRHQTAVCTPEQFNEFTRAKESR